LRAEVADEDHDVHDDDQPGEGEPGRRLDTEQRLHLLEHLPEGIALVDPEARLVFVNTRLRELTGWSEDEVMGRSVFDFIHPDDLAYMVWSWETRVSNEGGVGKAVAGRLLCADGSWLAMEAVGRSLLDDPLLSGMILSARDVTTQLALVDSPARLRSMIDRSSDIVLLVSEQGSVIYANRRLTSLLSLDCDRVVDTPWSDLFEPTEGDEANRRLAAVVAGGSRDLQRWRSRMRTAEGHSLPVELHAVNQLDDPAIEGVIVTARDVSSLVAMEAELADQRDRLAHEASHDGLTGLSNRTAFLEHLEGTMALRAAQPDLGGAVVAFCDLDGFKAVNDELGHHAGDEVLRIAAQRLQAAVRAGDSVARWGGDELVVLLAGAPDTAEVDALCERVEHAIAQPFSVTGGTVQIGVSVGTARAEPGDTAFDDLMRRADAAMYQVKATRARPAN